MKFTPTFFTAVFICFSYFITGGVATAQEQQLLKSYTLVTTGAKTDTLKKDSLKTDTLKKTASGLTSAVNYSARDSTIGLNKKKIVLLYGDARVKYGDFELSADFIQLDQEHNTVHAVGYLDKATGRYMGWPIFKQGDQPPVSADSMTYNYETKKLSVVNVRTEVEGGYLLSQISKKNQYDEISFKNGEYTTCNLPHPHYYLAIKKGMVFDKQVVTGPAYLVIEDVVFPFGIPFGFFPKTGKRQSGILFPTFGEDGVRGFFMRDLGYYIGLNDYWDAETRVSLYSKGSYEGSFNARYRKTYKYDGNVGFNYASTRLGVEGTPEYKPNKDFRLTWSHSQRNEANPGTTFQASVEAGTSRYNQNTGAGGTYDARQISRNTMRSSIAYGKTFLDGLFNFSAALSHSQDIESRTISLLLPSVNLSMSSINPFDSKNRVGDQKWFQRISVAYTASGSNSINTTEDQLFKKGSLNKFTNGITHSFSTNYSQNIFRYFQFNAAMPYTEHWAFKTISKRFSTADSSIVTDTIPGFKRAGDYTLSGGFSTKLYGQVHFRKGRTTDIRHTMTPSIGFTYKPDFSQEKYGTFRKVQSDITGLKFDQYSIFEGSVAGSPSAGKTGGITFSVDNTVEAKRKGKGDADTVTEKVPIIQGLSFSGSYNFAVDEYKLSDIGFSGRTAFFKQKLGINFNGNFSPYALSDSGIRINEYAIKHGTLARLTNVNLSTDFSFNSEAAKGRGKVITDGNQNRPNMSPDQSEALDRISRDPNAFVDFKIPWNLNVSYSFNYSKPALIKTITNTLNFSGDLNVTPKWKVQFNSGYDFFSHKISYTNFSIYRDLHCWDLAMTWVPFGTYRSYSVNLKVRASVLQDLKLSRRRDYYTSF